MKSARERYARVLDLVQEGERLSEFSPEKLERVFKEEEALLRGTEESLKCAKPEEVPSLISLVKVILESHKNFRAKLLEHYERLKIKKENIGIARVNLQHLQSHYKVEPIPRFMDKEI